MAATKTPDSDEANGTADGSPEEDAGAPDDLASDGDLNEDALRERVGELRAEAEAARLQAAEYLDDLQRLKAEFENFRKRLAREQTEAIGRASERLVEDLLGVVDDFDLALVALEDLDEEYAGVAKGIEAVYEKFNAVLAKEGIERIDTSGVTFDTEIHEAVAHEDDGSDSELVVAEVYRPGYKLRSKVIRPAMVKVSSGAGE